jgi:hypothetical protein
VKTAMIRFDCPHCSKGLRTENSMAGAAFNCPGCRGRVRVPQVSVELVEESGREQAGGSERARFVVRPFRPLSILSACRLKSIAVWSLLAAVLGGGAGGLIASSLNLEQTWLCVGVAGLAAASMAFLISCVASRRAHCTLCHRWKTSRRIGSIQRDAQSAKEALEAGDLAALRALSPEGATVLVSVSHCRACSLQAPIDVLFATKVSNAKGASGSVELAHVTYPGGALPAFERLCKMN